MTNKWLYCTGLAAVGFAAILSTHIRGERRNLEGEGIVFVYYTQECAAANIDKDCVVVQGDRPAFDSMAACMAHATEDLNAIGDEKRLALCEKMRSA